MTIRISQIFHVLFFLFGVNFGTLLTDLLKAFDCISHELTYLQNYMRMVLAWEH